MTIPANLADVVAGLQDGTLGTQQIMIGDLVVNALTGLRIPRGKDVTRRPVQAGYSVDMGVVDRPDEIEMEVVFSNPDYSPEGMVSAVSSGSLNSLAETWAEKRDLLYSMFDGKEIVDVTTHDQSFQSFVISEIDPLFDPEEDWDGWVATVRFSSFAAQTGATAVDAADAKTAATAYVGSF